MIAGRTLWMVLHPSARHAPEADQSLRTVNRKCRSEGLCRAPRVGQRIARALLPTTPLVRTSLLRLGSDSRERIGPTHAGDS